MEPHETQRQKGVEMSHQQSTHEAPATLLEGVLSRLERRDVYLSAGMPAGDLVDALEHPQWEIRAAAVRALGDLGEQAPLEPLMAALYDEHRMVRVAAVRALSRMGTRVPLDQLVVALHDHEWEVREMIVLALAELDAQAVRPLLLAALHDSNGSVREAAASALSRYDAAPVSATPPVIKSERIVPAARQEIPMDRPSLFARLLPRLLRPLSILKRQIPLLHKSLWIGTPLFMLLWCILAFYRVIGGVGGWHRAALYLALFTTISAAAGTAFIYGGENDAGLELTLSTPTSIRGIMFYRFLLVAGYNMLLSAGASAVIALMHGGSLWEIIQLWLGPLVLLSSFTLMLSMLIGSWLALSAAVIVELSQSLAVNSQEHWLSIQLSFSSNWQTSPTILCLALLLIVFALFYASRQPRLSQI
jgi:hypothetical protein